MYQNLADLHLTDLGLEVRRARHGYLLLCALVRLSTWFPVKTTSESRNFVRGKIRLVEVPFV